MRYPAFLLVPALAISLALGGAAFATEDDDDDDRAGVMTRATQ